MDLPDIRWGSAPGQKAYVYFPSLRPLRPWEGYLFSPISSILLESPSPSLNNSSKIALQQQRLDPEKSQESTSLAASRQEVGSTVVAGVSFFIKKAKGMTKLLQKQDNLFTLLEGPYPNTVPSEILKCDHVLLIAGGIGIAGVISRIKAHHNVQLAWATK